MSDQFDLFRIDESSNPVWFGTAPTLDQARAEIQRHACAAATTYMVYSQSTAQRILYVTSQDAVVRVSESTERQ
jgi:hypothetical protein